MNNEKIQDAVFNGIRKTINRFREQPFYYFTESDIHASLSNDIMHGHSDIFVKRNSQDSQGLTHTPVSLIHHEYPTNFRYQKEKLKDGYCQEEINITNIGECHGDRGNYDLAILDPDFARTILESKGLEVVDKLRHIVNKDINNARARKSFNHPGYFEEEELIYAIEVKFVHVFNARNKQMIDEVRMDNEKLKLAIINNHCRYAINLVFCSSEEMSRSDKLESVICRIREYVVGYNENDRIFNIFIESFINSKAQDKETPSPRCSINQSQWAQQLKGIIKAKSGI